MVTKDNANKIRAEIICCALEVEDALNLTLGHWYCPAEKDSSIETNRLVEEVLVDLPFEKKIKLLKGFKDDFPDQFPDKMLQDLNGIRDKRNEMAHRHFLDPKKNTNADNNSQNDKFEFLKIGKKSFSFAMSDLEEYKKLCETTRQALYLLAVEVSKELKKPMSTKRFMKHLGNK